jgi:replicative DNA helicase
MNLPESSQNVLSADFSGGKRTIEELIPPQNVEAEEAILGGIIFDPSAIARVEPLLVPEAFYLKAHQMIYRGLLDLHRRQEPTDLMMISSWLKDRGVLEQFGGQSRIVQILDRTISAVNIDQYALLVMDKYARRLVAEIGVEAQRMAMRETAMETLEILGQLEKKLADVYRLVQRAESAGLRRLNDLVNDEAARMSSASSDGEISYSSTGFPSFDGFLGGGFKRPGVSGGRTIVIGGRTSMGKSALMGALVRNAATQGIGAICFTVETSSSAMTRRAISLASRFTSWGQHNYAGVPYSRMVGGTLQDQEWTIVGSAISDLMVSDLPIWIDDNTYATPQYIEAQVRSKISEQRDDSLGQVGVIFIDYLQELQNTYGEIRQHFALEESMKALSKLAREVNCDLVIMSQLNREVEQRPDKRPTRSDFRGSGAIEEKADILVGIYRDEYYNPGTDDRGIVELRALKVKDGPCGVCRLGFQPEYGYFEDLGRVETW